jgi:hypothetical protein
MNHELSSQEHAYIEGFAVKCAEYGVDPETVIKHALSRGVHSSYIKSLLARVAKELRPEFVSGRRALLPFARKDGTTNTLLARLQSTATDTKVPGASDVDAITRGATDADVRQLARRLAHSDAAGVVRRGRYLDRTWDVWNPSYGITRN